MNILQPNPAIMDKPEATTLEQAIKDVAEARAEMARILVIEDIRTVLALLSADALHSLEDNDAVHTLTLSLLVKEEVNRRLGV